MGTLDVDVDWLRRRRGVKWSRYAGDVLPAWVADMDFPVAPAITGALSEMIAAGDFGYPAVAEAGLAELFTARMMDRYSWQVDPEHVALTTDVLQGIAVGIELGSQPGEGVVVQPPIYPPFLHAVEMCGRFRLDNPLIDADGRYELDLDGLRDCLDRGGRVLLLCNPHNPTGRVLGRGELEAIAEMACDRDLTVVSDEIHGDLVYPGCDHVPFATLGEEVAARTITLTSATKAFNIAGLRLAVVHFGHPSQLRRFEEMPRYLRGGAGSAAVVATQAAWRQGQPWLDEVLVYLRGNRDRVHEVVDECMPGVVSHLPEATYLAWLDCRRLDLEGGPFEHFLERAKVALSNGEDFGPGGQGFVRLNFATSRSVLDEILERMTGSLSR